MKAFLTILVVAGVLWWQHTAAPTAIAPTPTPTAVAEVSLAPSTRPTVLGTESDQSNSALAQLVANPQAKCHVKLAQPQNVDSAEPDPNCTPGAIDPAVTQANIQQTICRSGYTATVRPPVSYTNPLKLASMQDYGYVDTDPQHFEEDHLISLELGGSPKDVANLWAEPHASPNQKDKVENYLHEEVCAGKISLSDAQNKISHDWFGIYAQVFGPE